MMIMYDGVYLYVVLYKSRANEMFFFAMILYENEFLFVESVC